jgi:hypothetical protein
MQVLHVQTNVMFIVNVPLYLSNEHNKFEFGKRKYLRELM